MKIFLINLKKDAEKLAAVDAQLKRLNVPYERVEGVYGKDLPIAERKRAVSAFRWWCAEGRPIVPAEIGCAHSHFSIYRRMIAEGLDCACILEDDVVLDVRFPETVAAVERMLNAKKSQVVLLNDHFGLFKNVRIDCPEIKRSTVGTCTDGYILTRQAAAALLKANNPLIVPCDAWRRWTRMGLIELYHALPTSCWQDRARFGSSTSEGRFAVADLPLGLFVWHKFKRIVGKSLDEIFQRVTKR